MRMPPTLRLPANSACCRCTTMPQRKSGGRAGLVTRPKRSKQVPARYRQSAPSAPAVPTPAASIPDMDPPQLTLGELAGQLRVLQDKLDDMTSAAPAGRGKRQRRGTSVASVTSPSESEVDQPLGRTKAKRRRIHRTTPSASPSRLPSEAGSLLSEADTPSDGEDLLRTRRRARSSRRRSPHRPRRRASRHRRTRSHSSSRSRSRSGTTRSRSCSPPGTMPSYTRPIHSFGSLVGEGVDSKLRAKIIDGAFIELGELLPDYRQRMPEDEYAIVQGAENAKLVKRSPKHQLNFTEWLEAFETYSMVLIESARSRNRIIHLVRTLTTYKRMLIELRRLGYDWLAYDRHFRLDLSKLNYSWATVRQDLLMLYQRHASSQYSFRPQRQTSNAHGRSQATATPAKGLNTKDGCTIPFGYCIAFHTRGERCQAGQNCKFQHACPSCQSRHPVFNPCSSGTRSNPKQITTTPLPKTSRQRNPTHTS